MADNIDVTPGSGKTIGADEVGGVLHQRVKVVWGPDGTVNDADTATGKPLPVQVRSSTGLVPIGEPTDDKNAATDTTSVSVVSLLKQLSAYLANLSSTVLAEDAVAGSGDKGQIALAVRRDSLSAGAADGDYVTLNIDANGRLYVQVNGDVAHDGADSGAPVKQGAVAIAHGTNPTAVAAADRTNLYANRAGIPFVIGGHPNIITRSATIDDADNAQTNQSLLTVSSGTKIVVTAISAIASSSNSGSVAYRIGFAAASLPAASEAGADGILMEGKVAAGGGNQKGNGAGILGVGGDGEDLRITCDDPSGGSLFVTFSYYTIES